MSVTASIRCLECGSRAPDAGDCGHIGYPSLEDDGGSGDLASFESIYRGYASLGLRLSILDHMRAWLIEHASHKVELTYEGEPVGRARQPARRVQGKLTPFRPDAYVRCFFELRCVSCETSVRSTGSELMMPFDEEVSGKPLARFEERVLDAEPESFYRTSGLLDPRSTDFDAIRAFLRRHGTHRLRARSVAGETWAAVDDAPRPRIQTPATHGEPHCSASRVHPRTSLGPPLRVAWVFNAAVRASLVVEGGVVYTVAGNHDTIVALDRTGSEIWRTPGFGDLALFDSLLSGERLWLPVYAKESRSYRHWAVDPRTGRKELTAEGAPSMVTFVSPGEFIGARWRPGGKLVESVGRFALGPPLRTVWEIEVPSDSMRGTLGGAVAFDGQRVLASWGATVLALEAGTGRELWRVDLSPYGRHWGHGDHLRLSTSGGAVVYGLIGSLHVLSAETGAAVWCRTGGEVNAYRAHYGDSLCLAGHHAFGGSELEHLCLVLALPGGAERCRTDPSSPGWRKAPLPRPRFTTVPRPTDELVYLGDMDGRLWALSSDTADPVWMHGLRGARSGIERIVIADDRLFALLFDGTLYCLVPS
jgi:outer membrane protein assembly factor BamB